jgi:1-acyl-sn-glycerol-3-phosphate acyltransferase
VFYTLLKAYSRFAHRILFRKIRVQRPDVLAQEGPLLFAANHPNSFLDGIILTTLSKEPVYSLARGDAFRGSRTNRLLRRLRLLPVYRQSEGVENLEHNYTTFSACLETFSAGSSVLIFSEGRCENEWHLRPLKKGTARLAFAAWEQGIPLTVIPTGFNYSSFFHLGKEVHLNFGRPIHYDVFDAGESQGRNHLAFNARLKEELEGLVYEIREDDQAGLRQYFPRNRNLLLLLPGLAGWLLHAPLVFAARGASARFRKTGHYDSVLHALLLLGYLPYLLLLGLLAAFLLPFPYPLLLLLSPLLAASAVRSFGR